MKEILFEQKPSLQRGDVDFDNFDDVEPVTDLSTKSNLKRVAKGGTLDLKSIGESVKVTKKRSFSLAVHPASNLALCLVGDVVRPFAEA